MKQLKFMLAAATAISLATAAQAATADKILVDDDFNDAVWDGKNPVDVKLVGENSTEYKSGYSFLPTGNATAADNDSKVENGALKVNTGTDPLLRALDFSKSSDAAQDVNLAATEFNYLNIDAMVKFTVTPEGETVTATDEDKLMIFLKEVPATEEGGASSTKLMVKATKYQPAGVGEDEEEIPETNEPNDYEVTYTDGSAVAVSANTSYLLTVKTIVFNGEPMFEIYIDGKQVKPVEKLNIDASLPAEANYFPALTAGKSNAVLTYVGFAGEGEVDDLVVTKNYDVSALGFTFTWSGDGITGVTYTIGEDTYEVTSGTAFQVQPGTSFTVNVALADWYKLAKTSYVYNNVTEGDTVEIPSAEKVITTEPAADGTVTVNPSATKEELAAVKTEAGITDGAFKDVTDTTELGKVLTWQSKNSVSGDNVSAVEFETAAVTNVDGSVESVLVAKGPAAEAYLLNCDPASTVEGQTLQDAKDNFKFEAKDLADLFDLTKETANLQNSIFSTKGYNGSIVLEGKEELSGEWKVRASGHKFFRARLVK